ncbi:MAG: dihydrolipoyl dehydrogenase, partial [Myxococcales bacterium]
MANAFDVVVIGAGPGGYVAAIRAAQLGLKTAIVERDKRLGGTCLLRGCIPTKALLYSAELLEKISHSSDFGIDVKEHAINWLNVMKNKERVVAKMAGGVNGLMKKNNIQVFKGHGKFVSRNKMTVEGETKETIESKHFIIATGSEVRNLPLAPPDHKTIVTSDSILELEKVPKSLIVMGAGAVGMEFASIFRSFGAEVTIIEMMAHLLPIEDEDCSKEIEKIYRRRKINFLLESKVEKVEKTGAGVKVTVAGKDGKTQTLEAEMLLVAVGRKPVIENLGLEAIGVKIEKGAIPVDKQMKTNVDGIYAIGDVVPTPWLAHVASHEGIVAAEAIAGKHPHPINYDRVPNCTYTYPAVASVGLTEKKAKERGYDVKTGVFPFAAIGKATISRENDGFIKIGSDRKYDEVLGVHIVNAKATELIAEA